MNIPGSLHRVSRHLSTYSLRGTRIGYRKILGEVITQGSVIGDSIGIHKIKKSLKLGYAGTSARPVLTNLPGSRMSGAININMANKILQCELGVQNCQ
jgi:hypothetical protein